MGTVDDGQADFRNCEGYEKPVGELQCEDRRTLLCPGPGDKAGALY